MLTDSELIINSDGSIFHLHLLPEQIADRIVICGDPQRVSTIASYFDKKELDVQNREFHTITGSYKGKRITALSHGIGCDNLDIVVNELDALANIDFKTRKVRSDFHPLTIVRIGTSGSLQPFIPIGAYVVAEQSIGFDGVIYFYRDNSLFRNKAFEDEFIDSIRWKIEGIRPYIIAADKMLVNQICKDDIIRGLTIAANGFYGPQGRELRLHLSDPTLNSRIKDFVSKDGKRITNYEMESSALAALSALMGHKAITVCCIIAGRADNTMNTNYKDNLPQLIEKVLERI